MHMTRRNALRWGLLASGAALCLGAETAPTEFTVALSSPSFSTAAFRIADAAGMFARHDLKPRFVMAESGNAATTVMLSGSAQLAVSGPGEALAARARGQKLVLVGNIYRGLSAVVVVAKAAAAKTGIAPDAPVRERLKGLDGLVIAAPSPTAVFGISPKLAAESVGAKPKFVYMGQVAMPAALDSGAVQGFIAGAPFWGIPVLAGTAYAWIIGNDLPAEFLTTTSGSVQTTEEWVSRNPATLARLHAVMRDTAAFIAADPDGTKRILAKLYPSMAPAALDLAFSKEWRNWTRPDFTVADVQQEINLMRNAGQGFPGLDGVQASALLGPQP